MQFLPYAIGIFLLTPFFIWAGFYVIMPGPKWGVTDAPLTASMLMVSLPLVAYHSLAGLAFVANSMAGRTGETAPVWTPARRFGQAMAPLTILLTAGSLAWLASLGESAYAMAGVAALGLFMALSLAGAESSRSFGHMLTAPAAGVLMGLRQAGRLLLAVPVIGHMLREIAADPNRAGPWIALNLALSLAALVWVFGPGVMVFLAMASVPLVFCAILMFCTE
ncbi:hypothetical protein F1654_09800 [Alkalicaulis satelles]|uniref:Uncharacterized protein n=1 Tax=Alkalicaulis satelles TaxID=2609175 RepID=A0A5M6ZH50_9PROT|nr:hypothetical protein [Alkalicaulis satelles]KAA5804059.1 hypothetical protein F1654_09800 [Alkalicaulis satelles]